MSVPTLPLTDSRLLTALTELSVCLCAQVEAAPVAPLCFCGLVPGDGVAYDYSSECADACGMGWVRLTTGYPSSQVGQVNTNLRNCSAVLGFEVEVGIIRCAPMPNDQGEPPSPEEMALATQAQIADMLLMRQAINCCRDSNNYVLGAYTPVGPEGGVVGGVWNLAMQEF